VSGGAATVSSVPVPRLRAASLDLEKLRLLLRLAHERAYVDHRGFEHVMRNLDETGRMLGGWIRYGAGHVNARTADAGDAAQSGH